MLNELTLWPQKLKEGIQLAHSFYQTYGARLPKNINKIAFVGMGGSGIAGKIVQTILEQRSTITTLTINSPVMPKHIDANTLAIVTSYSGNTWETVDALQYLIEKKIPVIAISRGGKIIEMAQKHNLPCVMLPTSLAPRTALGHFLGFFFGLFDLMRILPQGLGLAVNLSKEAEKYVPLFVEGSYFKDFLYVANEFTHFHVWGVAQDSGAAAYRATTQFNENSKIAAVYNEFPELAHNLLVGLDQQQQNPLVVFFYTDFLPTHINIAIQAISELLKEKRVILYKPPILGDTFENQIYNIILWADFASYHLGVARDVDVESVHVIEELKKRQKAKGIV